MNLQDPKPKRVDFAWMKTIAVLLFGLAAGLALIYALQPPSPTPGSLLYEVTLISSDNPIKDFTPHFQMLQSNAAQGVRITSGGGISGNITFSSEPRGLTQFALLAPFQLNPAEAKSGIEFEIRGTPVRDRIRTEMKVGVNYTSAFHQIDLIDGEYRALEVIRGDNGARQWCYAIVTVQRAKAPPPRTMVAPRAAPPDTSNTP